MPPAWTGNAWRRRAGSAADGQNWASAACQTVPIASYEAAHYVVVDGEREMTIRIGHTSAELDEVLDALGATSGICITAANPSSQWQSEAVNATANEQMAAVLREGGWRTLPHSGRSPDGAWSEEGFFVLGLDEDAGRAIAERFGQFGIVVAERGVSARLVLTRLAGVEAGDE